MGDILIKNGFIATMDSERRIYPRGSVYISEGRIESVGKTVDVPRSPEFIINAEHKVVMPGFVNTHAHLQQYFRGVYELIGDFYGVNLPLEGYRRPEDMQYLGLASCAELVYGGSTTAVVIYTYPDGFAKAAEETGNRVVLGADVEEVDLEKLRSGVYEYIREKGEAAVRRAVNLYKDWHGKADGKITTIIAPKAADLVTVGTYLKCKELAEEFNLKMSTHLSQSWREVTQVKKLYGKTPTEHLKGLGVLNNRLMGAHCTYVTERELSLIREAGVSILHCRAVTNPLLRWLDQGIKVGFGTDDYHHDMLQLLREILWGAAARAKSEGGAEEMLASSRRTARPNFYELLELATRGGAEVLGLGEEIGSLEPGKKADVITVDLMNPFITPTRDPLTSIVLYGTPSDIDNVIVDGRILKLGGRLTSLDLEQALLKAQERVDEIIGRFFDDYPEQRKAWEEKVFHRK